MLLSNFKALGPISIPTPTVTLTEFFHVDAVARVHLLPVSWYLIFSLCVYQCCWIHIMYMLCSTFDAISSRICPILFRVLTLNVAICIVCLHFSNFCCLSSVADFLNIETRAPTSAGSAHFFTSAKIDAVYTCGLSVGHGYLSTVVFILIHRSQPYRWEVVVPRSLNREIHTPRTRLGIALGRQRVYPLAFTSTLLCPMASVKKYLFSSSVKF